MSNRIQAKPATWATCPLREEALGDAALIEDFDCACMQPARASADKILGGAPLDNSDVDSSQGQLARQHQPGRATTGNHYLMFCHPPPLP